MTTPLDNPKVIAALQRAGMSSPSADVIERLTLACQQLEGGADAVLEISQANWANEDQGTDVLVVQTRDGLLLVGKGRRGRFKPTETFGIRAPFDYCHDLAEDDEIADASVFFLAKDGHKPFLLSWTDEEERHRMFMAMFEAHRGIYSRWGLQLDPANYVADFDRYYAEIRAKGPTKTDGWHEWLEQEYGEFDIANALGFAAEWRRCELEDEVGSETSSRVMRISFPQPWIDAGPEARRVIVRLGEQLYDEGLLGSPYDERTFDTGEPLSHRDEGPKRLIALMTMAGYANALRDPRAAEWIEAARKGIPAVPPTVFLDGLRELWSEIEELPAVDEGPPPEIPIWEDVDVRAISTSEGDGVVFSVDGLSPSDRDLVTAFMESEHALNEVDSPSAEAVSQTCLRGVAAFEGLSPLAPTGWRKLILYRVSDLTYDLWETHKHGDPAAKLAHWVVATIEANGWGPDGRSTPLGQHHSYAMGVAVGTGVGVIRIDPETGQASAPSGDEAREAAVTGHF